MSPSQTIIVVAGAHGNLGKLLCDALLARAQLEGKSVLVRGLVRRGSASESSHATPAHVQERAESALVLEPVDYDSDEDLKRVCVGAHCVVSTLQGLEEVIVGVQSRLLKAALACGVRRYIPSDFSGDFTKLPEGSHRNFDLRRRFHREAERMIQQGRSSLQFTSIFQGGFTELLGSGWVLFDYKKRRVAYFGSPDTLMEFTTWKNTAEFTAAVAMDTNPTPRSLYIAGQQLSPRTAQTLAKTLTGSEFALKRVMPTSALRVVISLVKLFKPGKKDEVMPMWVAMQYGYCGALGLMSPPRLDNDRYKEIQWTSVDDVVQTAFANNTAAS